MAALQFHCYSHSDNANLIIHTEHGNGANALWLHLITFSENVFLSTKSFETDNDNDDNSKKMSNKCTIARKKTAIREKNPILC
jgi:hypothetical protein